MLLRYLSIIPVLSVLMFTLIACSGYNAVPHLPDDENPDRYTFASSDLPREKSPDVSGADLLELCDGNMEFAFDIYDLLSEDGKNFMFSPFSISQALAMTWGGARGNTETQMQDTMHFTLGQDGTHPAFNLLDLELQSRGEGASGRDEEPFRLNIANSTWGQIDWPWQQAYLDLLGVNYGAGMRLVNFIQSPEECRLIINDWVEDKTENRIQDLLPEGIITQITRLVLVNAIYFNAAWNEPFEEDMTHPGTFTLNSGDTVTTDLMEQTHDHYYAEGGNWQALDIHYDGDELSMLVILPDRDHFDEIESGLSADFVNDVVSGLEYAEVEVTFPKFGYVSEFNLSDALSSLGMTDAFIPGIADFSGMDGSNGLFIQDVVHKAFIEVDEEGTEAAAATGVVVGFTSAPVGDYTFRADHPFIYLIRDIATGAVLFVGRVMDPTQE